MSSVIFYAGDTHGRIHHITDIDNAAMEAGAEYVVQVGDFGCRWPGSPCAIFKYFEKRARKNRAGPTWITCGGNHDNWDKWNQLSAEQGHPDLVELAPGCFYAQRGSVHSLGGVKHIFCGGAESTDKHMRTAGTDWWAAETPTYSDLPSLWKEWSLKSLLLWLHMMHPCAYLSRERREMPLLLQETLRIS